MLGTARWGSFIDQPVAYEMLDKYAEMGGKLIDTATNYPINAISSDLGLAIKWLSFWISHNPGINMEIFVKVGARDNSGSAAVDLTPTHLSTVFSHLSGLLNKNLMGIGIHWDNRGETKIEQKAIEKSCEALSSIEAQGSRIGLSGIINKKAYSKLLREYEDNLIIQVKETITDQNSRLEYRPYFSKSQYFAYGISGNKHHGGNERNKEKYEHSITRILQRRGISGVIIGPRNVSQLESSMAMLNSLIQNSPD